MTSLANYILWRWLFVMGFAFWVALCTVDKLYMGQDELRIRSEEQAENVASGKDAEMAVNNQQLGVDDFKPGCKESQIDLSDSLEGKKIEQSYILNAVTLIGFLIFVTVVKIRNGNGSDEEERDLKNYELMFSLIAKKDNKKFLLFNQNKKNNNTVEETTPPKEQQTTKEQPKEIPKQIYIKPQTQEVQPTKEIKTSSMPKASFIPKQDSVVENSLKGKLQPELVKKVVEVAVEEKSVVDTCSKINNSKPLLNPLSMNRPESRSMRVPTIDVQSLQEKLEKLEQSVAAMRKRRIGIVSGTKEFQRFLNELTPVC